MAVRVLGWVREAWVLVGADLPLFSLAAFLTIVGTLLSAWILTIPLTVGLCIMFLEKLQGNQPALSHLFEGLSRFPAAVFVWAVYLLGLIPFGIAHMAINSLYSEAHSWSVISELVGHWIVATPLLLAAPYIAHRDLGGRETVRLSWAKVRTILPVAFVTTAVLSALLALGIFACGLGVILTLPVVVGISVLVYRDLEMEGTNDATPETLSTTDNSSGIGNDVTSG